MKPVISQDVFESWLKNKGLKERTIKNYFYYFGKFDFPRLNQEAISQFFSEHTNRNTIARAFIKNLKECMLRNHAALNIDSYYLKEINDVYFPGITGRNKARLINPLAEKQIFLLEKAFNTEQLKLMLLICYTAGLRLGELIKIRINAFNWETWKQSPDKRGEVRVFGKGDKEGIALLPTDLMKRIAIFINSNQDDFKGIDSKLFSIGERSFQVHLQKAGIKSGITKIGENGDIIDETRVHPHKLRHSHAHNLLMKGLDIRFIKESLRHSSIQSTQIYTHVSKRELSDKLDSLDQMSEVSKPQLPDKA